MNGESGIDPAASASPAAHLRDAAAKVLEFFALPGESSFEAFERIAERFYRETGVMAPGKDAGMDSGQEDPDLRRVKYDLWRERRIAALREALGVDGAERVHDEAADEGSREANS